MLKPFEHFLTGVIDYAGLFPPAQLPMATAIANYTNYRASDDAWMLGRFICPASRLKELEPYRESHFDSQPAFQFSVLGSGGKDRKTFLERLSRDIDEINRFMVYHGERVGIEIFETRLPDTLIREPDQEGILALLAAASQLYSRVQTGQLAVYYEVGFGKGWRERQSATIQALAAHLHTLKSDTPAGPYRQAGFKIRCGGVQPDQYPTAEQIAVALNTCHRFNIPLKATAGLHHPVRHFNTSENVTMHGFLNLIGAAALSEAQSLDAGEIEQILMDEDPGSFMFTSRAFAWRGMRASQDDIRKARRNSVVSFGSCSFDEPREDLVALKLL